MYIKHSAQWPDNYCAGIFLWAPLIIVYFRCVRLHFQCRYTHRISPIYWCIKLPLYHIKLLLIWRTFSHSSPNVMRRTE